MKKKLLSLILLTATVFTMGCGSKTAISTSDFEDIAEEYDCEVVDAIDQYADYDFIEEATIAKHEDGWQIEFYVLENDSDASKMFRTNKNIFEEYEDDASSKFSASMENYKTYSITCDGKFMYLCQVDNTLLYVDVDEDYKDDAKDFIEDMGY